MGTPGLIRVFNDARSGTGVAGCIVTLLSQSDGYPSWLGKEIAMLLNGLTVVNGLSGEARVANGYECLAGQIVSHFKDAPGGYYLYPPSRSVYCEFLYEIRPTYKVAGCGELQPGIIAFCVNWVTHGEKDRAIRKKLFSGDVQMFRHWLGITHGVRFPDESKTPLPVKKEKLTLVTIASADVALPDLPK